MIKWLGVCLVLGSSTLFGFRVASDYRKRPQLIQGILQALRLLRQEIEYSVQPLPHALKSVANRAPSPCQEWFRVAAEALTTSDMSVQSAFQFAIAATRGDSALADSDYDVMLQLADVIALTNRTHLTQQFDLAIVQYEGLLEVAEDKRKRNEKLWQYFGALGGLFLVVLLL